MESYRKYPRTPHLPWSPGSGADDSKLENTAHFSGLEVVVTEKLDGENTSIYRHGLHARSVDSRHHPSRDWVKALHGRIASEIPDGWRLCGENVFALHSVSYSELESYFFLFSIWNEENEALSWPETKEWAALLGICTVPVLYTGQWDEKAIRSISIDPLRQEGYVVRTHGRFRYADFGKSVAKWVRKGHVQTNEHWMHQAVIPNKLKTLAGTCDEATETN